jgi:hypothetical protein
LGIQVIVQIEAFEEAFAHIVRQVWFFDWGHSFSSRANGDRRIASDGIELGKSFSELSSRSQSRSLVEPGSESHFVRIID